MEQELIEKLRNLQVEEDEEIVSFDVEALFPSVPMTEALNEISNYVNDQDISDEEAEKFVELSRICLSQNVFKWNDKYYKQTSGLSMGNGLSPFAANIYMSNLEYTAAKEPWFPRFWARYVDDVFAIVKRRQIDETLDELNKLAPTIKFTMERENERKLPFLDLLLEVKEKEIVFKIYRKPQQVQRYIPNSSNHPQIHKMAAFDSMIFRMFNTPLSETDFVREKRYIEETAKINGYRKEMIDNLCKKHEAKRQRQNLTKLIPFEKERRTVTSFNGTKRQIFVGLPYVPKLSDRIQKILRNHNINTYYSNNGDLKDIIGNLKDETKTEEKSGIYELECGTCEGKYRGQTSRRVADRISEHERAFRLKQPKKSAMAQHCIENKHDFGDFKLLKTVRDNRQLDAWESLLINRGKNLVNIDDPPIFSPLLQLK